MAAHRFPEARDPGSAPARDEAARWLEDHGDSLFRFAMARLGRRELAEDLVQETFVAALQSRERYSGGATVRTWLTSILKHKIIDHYRRLAARPAAAAVESIAEASFRPDGLWKTRVPSWKSPDAALEQREFWEVLDGCLGRLPGALAAVFRLREIEGLDVDELQQTLGISDGNIRVRLHRARLLLRECLEPKWFSTGRPSAGDPK